MSLRKNIFVDLSKLSELRKINARNPGRLLGGFPIETQIKRELKKLTSEEILALDLLQLYGFFSYKKNTDISEVIRLNSKHYLKVFSSLATKVYHPKKNSQLIFALLAGIASLARYEPIRLTNEIFELVNNSLIDKRKSIRTQAIAMIFAAMCPAFGTELIIKPLFKKKILKEALENALSKSLEEIKSRYGRLTIANVYDWFLRILGTGGNYFGGIRSPRGGNEILETFERWFGLENNIKLDF